jgi:hypothetical protein
MTAERTIAHREQQQGPLRAAAEARTKAAERVEAAKSALAAIGPTPRLTAALKAKAAADAAVLAKASDKGCISNCRQLLQAQVDQAADEVKAARAEIEAARTGAELKLEEARAAFKALPDPQSATPLADRLGLEGWKIDLTAAGLASIAANGLAALLLAFAAHGRRRALDTIDAAARDVTPISSPKPRDALTEADRFARTTFRPNPDGGVKCVEIQRAYRTWCRTKRLDPLPDREIGRALSGLFSSVGLYRQGRGANAAITGIEWRDNPLLVAAGSH